jgi:hypothetical protein
MSRSSAGPPELVPATEALIAKRLLADRLQGDQLFGSGFSIANAYIYVMAALGAHEGAESA